MPATRTVASQSPKSSTLSPARFFPTALTTLLVVLLALTLSPELCLASPTAPSSVNGARTTGGPLLSPGGAKSGKSGGGGFVPPPPPPLARVLDQHFCVSILSHTFGAFNASLRMRGGLHFPEHIHAELIPKGVPAFTRASADGKGNSDSDSITRVALPHFSRERSALDERYSSVKTPAVRGAAPSSSLASEGADAKKGKKGKDSKGTRDTTAEPGQAERPTLLAADIALRSALSSGGSLRLWALPAAEAALRRRRDAMEEGDNDSDHNNNNNNNNNKDDMENEEAAPTLTAEFLFQPQPAAVVGRSLVMDVPSVATTATAVLYAPAASAWGRAATAAAAAASESVFSADKTKSSGSSEEATAEGESGSNNNHSEEAKKKKQQAAATSNKSGRVAVGSATLRFLSEHEFILTGHVMLYDGDSDGASEAQAAAAEGEKKRRHHDTPRGRRETFVAHAYAPPDTELLDRAKHIPRSAAQQYGFFAMMSLTFVLQTFFGVQDARAKTARENSAREAELRRADAAIAAATTGKSRGGDGNNSNSNNSSGNKRDAATQSDAKKKQ